MALVVLTPLAAGLPAPPATAAEVTMSLEQAVSEGKIDLEIKSLGRSTGPCMKLVIRRRVPQKLSLTINSGIVFKSTTGKVQDMVVAKVLGEYEASNNTYRPDGLMILPDDLTHSFVLEAYCLNSDKPTPGLKEPFVVGGIDLRVRGILELAVSRKATTSDVQMAIWIDRPLAAGVTLQSLMARVSATEANVRAARALLAELREDGLERWIGEVGSSLGGVPVPLGQLRILSARTCQEAAVIDRSGSAETRKASPDHSLLILHLAITPPAVMVNAEDFTVQVGEESYDAFAVSRTPRRPDPDKPPRFEPHASSLLPGRLPVMRLGGWQVGFEVPEKTSQGSVMWRNAVGAEWSLDRLGPAQE
jgi:hypothetical protein